MQALKTNRGPARTHVEMLADFVVRARYEDLSEGAREALRIRILDGLGCAIGALRSEPIRLIREQVTDFGGSERCTLIGGGRSAPDRAAFYNGALVRYLDFNDSYLAEGETCHPSDNIAPVLAAAEVCWAARASRSKPASSSGVTRHPATSAWRSSPCRAGRPRVGRPDRRTLRAGRSMAGPYRDACAVHGHLRRTV